MTFTNAKLHYFIFQNKPATAGFGEILNLFLKDAGIEFEYVRYTWEEWPTIKDDLAVAKGLGHVTMPILEINGKVFNKTAPTLRYLSKQLGKYHGASAEEDHHLDVASDIFRDHLGTFGPLFRCTDEEKLREHFEKDTKKYLAAYETLYAEKDNGPYLLGENVSYADFLVYHLIDDESFALRDQCDLIHVIQQDYKHVAAFIQAFNERPNLSAYLSSLKSAQ
ncbi:hypothetical protein [Absidia glauca]|uniref:GST C-terminal domain-containing protein n=1 Tax=Absidia glauca TaxID=4829 RepID=A0A168QNN2_ABSGL|nr:hypothetical protein [Absidia glauca]